MSRCVVCGAELEPPVRVPHTVYVKSLYRIGGHDYCRHHIIRAAVGAGVTDVRPGLMFQHRLWPTPSSEPGQPWPPASCSPTEKVALRLTSEVGSNVRTVGSGTFDGWNALLPRSSCCRATDQRWTPA